MKKLAFAAAIAALAASAYAQPFAAWNRFRTITINTSASGANVAGAVTNYPVLVRLANTSLAAGSNVLSDAKAGGADIRFTDSTGNTSLSYEIDQWSTTGAAIWVRLPTLPGNANTKIRLYWGKSDAVSASNSAAVFDSAGGFVGVWHLGNVSGIAPRPNSITGAPPATPANDAGTFGGGASTYVAPAGVIGSADELRGSGTRAGPESTSDYLDIGSPAGFVDGSYEGKNAFAGYNDFSTGFSYSVWVRPGTPGGNYSYLVELANGNQGNTNIQVFRPAVDTRFRYEHVTGTTTNSTNQKTTPTGSLVEGAWEHVTVTVGTGATPSISWYVNGALVQGPSNGATAPSVGLRTNAWLGKSNYDVDYYWTGAFDDARISKVARSANWVKLDYETQKTGTTAVTLGATETPTPRTLFYPVKNGVYQRAGTIVDNAPVVTGGTATSYSYTGTLPTGLNFSTSTGIISGTPSVITSQTELVVTVNLSGGGTGKDTLTITVIPGNPPGAPAAPTAVLGAFGSGQATVTWTVPSVTGSSAITGYKAVAVQDTTKSCTTTTALTCTISGLSGSVSFKVRAINTDGAGAFSPESNLLTPPTVPGASPAISGVAGPSGSGTVTVYWNAAANGGATITGYKVMAVSDTSKACTWTTGELLCVVSGLTIGQSYSFVVKATNAVGTGPASAASSAVTIPGTVGGITPFVLRVSGAAKPFTYTLPQEALATTDKLTMSISDVWGRTVWSRSVNPMKEGRELTWNGKASNGRPVSAGMYIVRISALNGGKTIEYIQKEIAVKPL